MTQAIVQCEQCHNWVPEADARLETYPGDVTLTFCPDHGEGRR